MDVLLSDRMLSRVRYLSRRQFYPLPILQDLLHRSLVCVRSYWLSVTDFIVDFDASSREGRLARSVTVSGLAQQASGLAFERFIPLHLEMRIR